MSNSRQAYLWGVVCVLLGACGFSAKAVWIRLAYREYPIDALSLLTLRMLFAVPFYAVSAVWLARRPDDTPIKKADWWSIAFLGLMGYYLASFFDFWGLQYITAGVERLILFINPTLVLLILALWFGQKIRPIQWAAMGITYFGVAIAFGMPSDFQDQKNLWLGAFLVFLAAFTYSIYLVGSGRLIPRIGSVKFSAWAMLFSSVGTFVHCGLTNGFDVFHFPTKIYYLAMLMAFFATVLPTYLVAEGIRRMGTDNAVLVSAVGPMITIVMAHYSLGETISFWQIIGTVFVLAGVLTISLKGKKANSTTE